MGEQPGGPDGGQAGSPGVLGGHQRRFGEGPREGEVRVQRIDVDLRTEDWLATALHAKRNGQRPQAQLSSLVDPGTNDLADEVSELLRVAEAYAAPAVRAYAAALPSHSGIAGHAPHSCET
ncbi:DUF6545 domain-containing protein [Streptomyces sp. NPDC053560]|uniref:DUF6545 domain-containing protein n=1 Tax=Streptomyces sp. NPDC053560 TaxID=3365711 RepID=UPI0037D57226